MSNNLEKTDNVDEKKDDPFVFQRKPKIITGDADDKFDVIVPKKNMILLIVIFGALFFAQFYYFSGMYEAVMYPNIYDPANFAGYELTPLIFLAMAIVPILGWGIIGSKYASKSIVKYLNKTVSRTRPKPIEFLLGYPLRTKDTYYLEAYPMDLDLGSNFASIKMFIKRVTEVMFLSMGLSVIICQIAAPFIYSQVVAVHPDWYRNIEEMIIDMVLYLGPLTLLILTLIMPVFWIAEDTQAYRINQYQDSVRLGFYLRTGLVSKILGFFGIILVFNLAQEFATVLVTSESSLSYAQLMADPAVAINVYTTTFIWFGLLIAMSAAIPFLVTLVYLSLFHERWVNNTRIKASEFMQEGTMNIRKPSAEHMKHLENLEMIDESGGFLSTKAGKIVIFILIIVVAIISIYMAFIWGFEDALFPS